MRQNSLKNEFFAPYLYFFTVTCKFSGLRIFVFQLSCGFVDNVNIISNPIPKRSEMPIYRQKTLIFHDK